MEYGDKIFKRLQWHNSRIHIPDLHSFVADIENGRVFVECRGYEIIESRTYKDDVETVNTWCGTIIAAANRLELLKIDLDSISY